MYGGVFGHFFFLDKSRKGKAVEVFIQKKKPLRRVGAAPGRGGACAVRPRTKKPRQMPGLV
jgi:hypothetical protein